jgi:hypothetical protein
VSPSFCAHESVASLQTVQTSDWLQSGQVAPVPWHEPEPLQVSVAVQKRPSSHDSPAAFGAQVPPSHVKHDPVQAELQQTPSAQWPLAHSAFAEHASPFGLPTVAHTPLKRRLPMGVFTQVPLQQPEFFEQVAPSALHRGAAASASWILNTIAAVTAISSAAILRVVHG